MITLIVIYLTFFIAVLVGAVILIQLGGWLAILSALLILLHYFLDIALLAILLGAEVAQKKKEKEM